MVALSVILSIVSVICALLLTLVILMQNPKHAGGIGAISGGVTESMFGANASSALVKITVWLAVIFLVCTLCNTAVVGRLSRRKSIGQQIAAPVAEKAEAAAPAAEKAAAPAAEKAAAPAAK